MFTSFKLSLIRNFSNIEIISIGEKKEIISIFFLFKDEFQFFLSQQIPIDSLNLTVINI